MSDQVGHVPVLLQEVIEALNIQKDAWYVDATFGLGGHAREILKRGGRVFGFDHDQSCIDQAKERFSQELAEHRLKLEHKNFNEMGEVDDLHKLRIMGILFDFGLNSVQLDSKERGFSFQEDADLDMRMDKRLAVTAKDLVNGLGKKELIKLLSEIAQEKFARQITTAILQYRKEKRIQRTKELAEIIEKAVGGRKSGLKGHLHPATKTFMALRIAVNSELQDIEQTLPIALDILQAQGRILTISFHEGEDRLVKRAMKSWILEGFGEQLTKKPIEASEQEKRMNPRSRSAKLRIFRKGIL